MQLQPGTYLQGDKYRIIRTLGMGGFGITYLAEHELAGRNVCIKEFFPKEFYNRDDNSRSISLGSKGSAAIMDAYKAKFIKEAKTIARLKHPNIIHIHDVFEENNTAYYVMEYIEGESLSDLVKRKGALAEAEAVGYIRSVAEALGYIHDRKIMHLDIKPANVMLNSEDGQVVVIDFGLSKQYDEEGNQTSSTPVGISAGFAPMEQYQQGGVKEFSPETDIYSLGATLYYLVTGQVPPQAVNIADSGLPELPAHLSSGVRNAIERSMEFQRKRRPHSAKEFLALLEDSAPEVVAVPTPTPISEKTAIVTPQPAVNESTVITVEAPKSEPKQKPLFKEEPKPEKKSKSKKGLWLMLVVAIVAGVVIFLSLGGDDGKPPKPSNEVSVEVTDNTITVNGVSLNMIQVDGGTFEMGSNYGESDEKPVRDVTLDGYWIAETEVTQALWKAVMGIDKGWSDDYGKGSNYPAYNVSYNEAVDFCEKLNELTEYKYGFRLPTEAEWEYAARGGKKSNGYKYSGSNNIDDVAWYVDNSGCVAHPVKSKKCNELGLYDMSGNLWEWCWDWYGSSYYSNSPSNNPTGPKSGDYRVLRGGSWSSNEPFCRVALRSNFNPANCGYNYGFRIASSLSLQ